MTKIRFPYVISFKSACTETVDSPGHSPARVTRNPLLPIVPSGIPTASNPERKRETSEVLSLSASNLPATPLVDGRTLLVLRFLGRGRARAHQCHELELQFSRLVPGPVEGRRPVRRCGSLSSPISTAGPWLRMALHRVGAVRPQSS